MIGDSIVVDRAQVGMRIDKLLVERLSISREQIQKQILSGKIKVNGRTVGKNYILKLGDVISDNNMMETFIAERKPITSETRNLEILPNQKTTEDKDNIIKEKNREIAQKEEEIRRLKNEKIQREGKINRLEKENKQVTELNNKIQELEANLLQLKTELESKKNEETRAIGTFDENTKLRFNTLQKNTNRLIVDYRKKLAEYQNELDKFKGKKIIVEKNENPPDTDEYAVPPEEKTNAPEEYDSWILLKIEEQEEQTQRLLNDHEFLLERYRKRLEGLEKLEDNESKSENSEKEIDTETKEILSIIDEIKQIISDLPNKIFEVFNKKEINKKKKCEEKKELKGWQKCGYWILICAAFVIIIFIIVLFYHSL